MKLAAPALSLLAAATTFAAEPWNQFRGPNAAGIAADSGYPVEFGPDRNLLWRTPVRPGKSSPALSPHYVFLTASDNGKLLTLCFDRQTGKLLWERSVDRARQEGMHALNEPASSTPVTDGDNVYVFFREFGLVSYDAKGNLRWKTPLGPFASSEGVSSSPIIAGGLLVMLLDQSYDGYIAGFDLTNGELRWKTARSLSLGFATPVVTAGKVVAAGTGNLSAYDPKTGKLEWIREGLAAAIIATPAANQTRIYAFGYGLTQPPPFSGILAQNDKNKDGKITQDEFGGNTLLIRVGNQMGDRDGVITEPEWKAAMEIAKKPDSLIAVDAKNPAQPVELWRYERSFAGVIPSALHLDGLLYFVKNGGILTALNAETVELVKSDRLPNPAGYSASLVADPAGVIYAASEKGTVTAIKAGRDWQPLQVNDLKEEIFATPALSASRIFVRTNEALYCFGAKR